jgi:hypothetical protein
LAFGTFLLTFRNEGKQVCVKSQSAEERLFVHLAYLDETGTDGYSPIVMYGALIVPVGKFGHLSALYSTAIQQILPVDKFDEFKEFHACELYNGTGGFAGIDENKRFTAIEVLIEAVRVDDLPFVYAAIDRKKFADSPFGTASPLITAFHLCLLGLKIGQLPTILVVSIRPYRAARK